MGDLLSRFRSVQFREFVEVIGIEMGPMGQSVDDWLENGVASIGT